VAAVRLLAPQIAITIVFFFWPAGQAVWYRLPAQDAFGLKHRVRRAREFRDLFADPRHYLASFKITALFSAAGGRPRHRRSRCCWR
jgi:sn-glycerol 3-phosphate transport system permease protein